MSLHWAQRNSGIALSSTEAEYVALLITVSVCLGVLQVLGSLDIVTTCVVYEANENAIHITKAVKNTKRTKHIDVRYHFIRDYIEKSVINIKPINTKQQKAIIIYLRELMELYV